jgi:hypothetical protein
VNLAEDCKPYIHGKEPPNATPGDLADDQRTATALAEMNAVVKECTNQEERCAALPNWVEDTKTEILIGSCWKYGGASRARTDDLIVANDGVCQIISLTRLRLAAEHGPLRCKSNRLA